MSFRDRWVSALKRRQDWIWPSSIALTSAPAVTPFVPRVPENPRFLPRSPLTWDRPLNPCLFQGTFTYDAVDFEEASYLERGAALTGVADSKLGIFSAWVRLDGSDGQRMCILQSTDSGTTVQYVSITRATSNRFLIGLRDAAASGALSMQSTPLYTAGPQWLHVLASWDLNGADEAKTHLYVNDVDVRSPIAIADTAVNYTHDEWGIGVDPLAPSSPNLDACGAEFYFAPGQYLDFSVEANRRKFISAGLSPVALGPNGVTPTGTAPAIYLHIDDGEAAADFALNRGSGGTFTPQGDPFVTCNTSPGEQNPFSLTDWPTPRRTARQQQFAALTWDSPTNPQLIPEFTLMGQIHLG